MYQNRHTPNTIDNDSCDAKLPTQC